MDIEFVFDVTTDTHEISIESNEIVVNQEDRALVEEGHNHDDRYYTKVQTDDKLDLKHDKNSYINGGTF
jgi:hypothetical protein